MTNTIKRALILNILYIADADIADQYNFEYAEIPEEVEDRWEEIENFLNKGGYKLINDLS